jgi:hypothetical protein
MLYGQGNDQFPDRVCVMGGEHEAGRRDYRADARRAIDCPMEAVRR